ncbi:hypothetical protein LMG29542_07955 [Paraburkholderia humisilvae]|uniref:Uncharacterized protein n=1 Tax=Paraburkholderia humisilvae TaxID=627669 RepID=A0A6J5FAT9_9BURK|nr:hypothetical protein LMG29542_07955 [Paraburkholderia humisilvae]
MRRLRTILYRDAADRLEHQDRCARRILAAERAAQRVAFANEAGEHGDPRLHFLQNLVKHYRSLRRSTLRECARRGQENKIFPAGTSLARSGYELLKLGAADPAITKVGIRYVIVHGTHNILVPKGSDNGVVRPR